MNELILPISFGVLFVAVLAGFIPSYKMHKIFRVRHQNLWEKLGKPTMILNNSIANNLSVLRFLWKKEYEKTKDSELIAVCRFNRIYFQIYLIFFGIVLLVFLWKIT